MFNNIGSILATQNTTIRTTNKGSMASVYKVILDTDDDILKDLDIEEQLKSKYIGAIQFRLTTQPNKRDESLSLALPYNKGNVSLPTLNEIVRIIKLESGGFTYERIIGSPLPNVNTDVSAISDSQKKEKTATAASSDEYSKVKNTGISRSDIEDNTNLSKLGDYFEPQSNIHKLKLYEGDTLLESRFGQSIRFSGYNNGDNEFSPTVTIRNGEGGESLNKEIGASTSEDINKDNNIIFLGSGNSVINYTLPIENKKESFFDYPSELRGNQILLSSDRIILSAKTSEMIFASKGDTGFITDGQFSIDATKGINITTDEHIYVDVKNNENLHITVGSAGTIALGSIDKQELEAAAKGETLVGLLGEMLDLITQQIYVTPAGPTSPGPTNIAQFASLKAKLNSILSNNVQLK
tara:strand:- start:441 stop:1670 length:1230 start_codon:yes stop_codon:yes gene_type:complete